MGCKSPDHFGFQLGASFVVTPAGKVADLVVDDRAKRDLGIVYVAWLSPRECALKIGFTTGTLMGRWNGIVRVMNAVRGVHSLRDNEWKDQERLIGAAKGQRVLLWFKPAERAQIQYAAQEGFADVSLAEAEERFLDWYYAPLFGRPLGERRLESP